MSTPTDIPPHIRILRILSGAGILIGAGGIVLSSPYFFWIWAISLWTGFIALVFDLRYEFRTKKQRWLRRGATVTVLGLLVWFTLGIAFYPNKLAANALSYEGQYKDGESIYGITWAQNFSDLRIILSNPTGTDFENLDFVINVDVSIIRDEKEITAVPITFLPNRSAIHIDVKNPKTGQTSETEQPFDGANELRIRCEKFPKNSDIVLILATSYPTPEMERALRTGKIPKVAPEMFFNWVRKRVPHLRITGEYSRLNRPYPISMSMDVKAQ
jgi:hypothetical protein